MHKGFLQWAALLGALSVALGAFAAHGLKKVFGPNELQVFETAVRYQFYHVFALLFTGIIYKEFTNRFMLLAGRLFISGIVVFSGSLYLLSYTQSMGMEQFKWLGAITPLGGTAFIAGWVCLFVAVYGKK